MRPRVFPILRRPTILHFVLASVVVAGMVSTPASGEEPAQTFVAQLRAVGYFDVALAYLDRIADNPAVDSEFRSALEFEKAQVHFDHAKTSRDPAVLSDELQAAQDALKRFIDAGEHPRRGEAQLQMASLQKIRADRMLADNPDDEQRAAARAGYLGAGETLDTIVGSIRSKLEDIKGGKIDPSADPAAAANRDQLRAEYLQGLVQKAETRKLAAETFGDPANAEAKALFEAALQDFETLAEKYADYVPGLMAVLYAAEINDALAKPDAAKASYAVMLDAPDIDALRDAKFRAAAGLIRLSKGQSQVDQNQAMTLAAGLADSIRPNERSLASALQLELMIAESMLDNSASGGEGAKRSKSDGRKILNRIVKLPGPHVGRAKELLSGLGIDTDDANAIPTTAERPENTAAAVSTARQLLGVIGETEALLQQLQSDESDDAKAQRAGIESTISETRGIIIDVLRQGLSMVQRDTDTQTITEARQFLAYVLSSDGRYRESIVVGTSLARLSPGTPTGLMGGVIALGGLQRLLTDDSSSPALIAQLSTLADYLTKTWPDDPKALAARSALVQLSLQNSDFARAAELIAAMPTGADRASLERLIGRLEYNESIAARQNDEADKSAAMQASAAKHLADGLAGLPESAVDDSVVKAALTLAKIQLRDGDSAAALATLDNNAFGPTVWAGKIETDDAFLSDLYSTELRTVVATMITADGGGGNEGSPALQRAIETMEKLQAANSGEANGNRLQAIYLGMARDIREEIDAAAPPRKAQLIDGFRVFLEKMAGSTQDPDLLGWVGQTLMALGEAAMTADQATATGDAKKLLETAAGVLGQLKSAEAKPPLSITYQLARAQRLSGNFDAALDTLEEILIDKPTMLDAQFEAALAYEQYAPNVPEKYTANVYKSALLGARPHGPKNTNVFWGWGKISQVTSGRPEFRDKFFKARYHLALCRYLWGKADKNQKIVEAAANDITKVAVLSPELGGAEQQQQFDTLLKRIQKELGQPATGLATPQ